jgi:hypothetical protein
MLPTLGAQLESHALVIHEDELLVARDVANLGDVDTCDSGMDSLATRHREKQFVVITAMQSELQIDFVGWFPYAGTGYSRGLDLRANTTLFADMPQICGEAVAEIDHGRGETFFEQKLANLDSGDGMEVPGKIGLPKFLAGE